MENRIKNWLENLDIHAIKNTDEMKLQWHNFIQECQADGMDVTGFDTVDSLKSYVAKHHVALQTKDCKPKKFKSIYHAIKTCSSIDETRKIMFGFLITETRDQIVSTDGRRLLVLPYTGSLESGTYDLYNGNALKMLEKMTYQEYRNLMDGESRNHPIFTLGGNDFADLIYADGYWFRKMEGTYPDYMSVIPERKHQITPENITSEWLNSTNSVKHLFKVIKKDCETFVGVDFANSTRVFNVDFLHDGISAMVYAGGFDGLQISAYEKYETDGGLQTIGPSIMTAKNDKAFYVLMPCRESCDLITVNRKNGNAPHAKATPAKKPVKAVESVKVEIPAIVKSHIIVGSPAPIEKPAIVEPVQEVQSVIESQETPVLEVLPESEAITPVRRQTPVFKRENIRASGLSPRAIQNLSFVQQINGDQMSRFEFIHAMSEVGNLKTSVWTDSKNKLHYLVNGQFLGQVAYNYANSIIASNVKVAMA